MIANRLLQLEAKLAEEETGTPGANPAVQQSVAQSEQVYDPIW